jgi:hypothetical protein
MYKVDERDRHGLKRDAEVYARQDREKQPTMGFDAGCNMQSKIETPQTDTP